MAIASLQEPEYRVEGSLKVTGRARYAADVRRPDGMLHLVYVRSPHPHALIRSVDVEGRKLVITPTGLGSERIQSTSRCCCCSQDSGPPDPADGQGSL